jgi:hypothetical protein
MFILQLTLTSVKTKYKSIPRPKGPSFSSKCWVKDKLELVPLFANIYKGFVALPSHLNFPQEIKKKNTKQKKYKENRERRSAPSGTEQRIIQHLYLVDYLVKTQESSSEKPKQNK